MRHVWRGVTRAEQEGALLVVDHHWEEERFGIDRAIEVATIIKQRHAIPALALRQGTKKCHPAGASGFKNVLDHHGDLSLQIVANGL